MPKYFLVARNGHPMSSSRAYSAADLRAFKNTASCHTFVGELTNKAKNVGLTCTARGRKRVMTAMGGPGAIWKAPKRRMPKPPKRDRNWRKKLVEKYPTHPEALKYMGMGAFSVKDLWPFGKKKPAARHPMTRTVYVMKTKSGSYIPVDRPPNSMMAGARRRKKRRR